jgi:large subunit ribosomal protein L21
MFAVLKTGGKQYKVSSGDVLRVEKLNALAGEKVQFNEVLMVGGEKLIVGDPLVSDAGVQAEIIDQIKGVKTINFVKRRRKHSSKRTKGHRQQLTLLRVTDILASGAAKSGIKAAVNGAGFVVPEILEAKAPAKAKLVKEIRAVKVKEVAEKVDVVSEKVKAPAKKVSTAKSETVTPKEAKVTPKKAAPKKAVAKKVPSKITKKTIKKTSEENNNGS